MNQIAKQVAVSTLLGAALLAAGCGSDDGFPQHPIGLQPPIAVNDNYSVLGNGQLTVAANQGVLVNDTPNQASITGFQNPTALGGTVTLNTDGSFTYTPPANQANTNDTFTYTLDNGFGTSTATVTIQIGARGLFVKNDAPAGGNGSMQSPFNTLAAAAALLPSNPGAQIIVFRGNGTSSGQNTPVTLGPNQGIQAQDPANPPTITGPITLGSGSTLQNLRIVGTTGGDAVIGTGIVGATISNVVVDQTSANAFNLTNPTGTVTMTNITATNIGRAVFPLSMSSGALNLVASNWTATNTVGNVSEANITGTGNVSASFDSLTFSQIGTASFGTGFEWSANDTASAVLRVSNLNFNTGRNGLFFTTNSASTGTLVVTGSTVTNSLGVGIGVNAFDTSSLKNRLSNSNLNGNLLGYQANAGSSAAFCARIHGNTSDTYEFINTSSVPMMVENLTGLTGENTGTLFTAGTVNNAPIGACGIP